MYAPTAAGSSRMMNPGERIVSMLVGDRREGGLAHDDTWLRKEWSAWLLVICIPARALPAEC